LPGKKETMQKLITNHWQCESGAPFERAQVLRHNIHPEGLDVDRISFNRAGRLALEPSVGHIISVLQGSGKLHVTGADRKTYTLEAGVHLYLPPGLEFVLEAEQGAELLRVSSPSASQTRGKKMLLRDETFIAACASGNHSLRWTFTPQYLSRRIFLHHDPVLLSRSGNPVSWFRTTMFDVAGLPENEDEESVFKMSYNSRTECNVCFDVKGDARVRMARHPYKESNQVWGPWFPLDGDSTYHLNEAAGSPEEECLIDNVTGSRQFFRNKHEVYIADGHVTLCCMFDPAPTGVERHRPGAYSDYEPLSQVIGTRAYETHQREIARYDEMVDTLSIAKATSTLSEHYGSPVWDLYLRGREAQMAIEREIAKTMADEGKGRERILAPWMQMVN
jgi:quercetin dioxygenase-like cupin family protein